MNESCYVLIFRILISRYTDVNSFSKETIACKSNQTRDPITFGTYLPIEDHGWRMAFRSSESKDIPCKAKIHRTRSTRFLFECMGFHGRDILLLHVEIPSLWHDEMEDHEFATRMDSGFCDWMPMRNEKTDLPNDGLQDVFLSNVLDAARLYRSQSFVRLIILTKRRNEMDVMLETIPCRLSIGRPSMGWDGLHPTTQKALDSHKLTTSVP